MKINVTADIRNMPTKPITEHGYIVARQDITVGSADLWYWGFYTDKDRAEQAAVEIRNGVVLEVVPDMVICPQCGLEVHTDFKNCPRCGADMRADKDCSTCVNSDETDGSNCYECIKGIKDNYEADKERDND